MSYLDPQEIVLFLTYFMTAGRQEMGGRSRVFTPFSVLGTVGPGGGAGLSRAWVALSCELLTRELPGAPWWSPAWSEAPRVGPRLPSRDQELRATSGLFGTGQLGNVQAEGSDCCPGPRWPVFSPSPVPSAFPSLEHAGSAVQRSERGQQPLSRRAAWGDCPNPT